MIFKKYRNQRLIPNWSLISVEPVAINYNSDMEIEEYDFTKVEKPNGLDAFGKDLG